MATNRKNAKNLALCLMMFSSLTSVSVVRLRFRRAFPRRQWGSIDCDPLCRYVAGTVTDDISVGVILVNRKSPGVTVVAAVQDDLFLEVDGTNENRPSGVPLHRKVVELVGRSPGSLPHTHAEITGYRGARRIEDFRSIGVPRGIA